MRQITDYLDHRKLIVHRPPGPPLYGNIDGGDCASEEGRVTALAYLTLPDQRELIKEEYQNAISQLEKDGVWIRYPDPPWNKPFKPSIWAFSRDQMQANLVSMGFLGLKEPYLRFLKRLLLKRFGIFYQNYDWFGFSDWGIVARSFPKISCSLMGLGLLAFALTGAKLCLIPLSLFLLGDLQNLVNTFLRLYLGKDLDNVGNDLNHTIVCLQARHSLPTPISWLSRYLYFKYRPGGILRAWQHYHREETGAPPLDQCLEEYLNKYGP